MNCEICGQKLALSLQGYKAHNKLFHNVKVSTTSRDLNLGQARPVVDASIRPERTTNRTKAQIVHDMEKVWGASVIPMVKPWQALGDR